MDKANKKAGTRRARKPMAIFYWEQEWKDLFRTMAEKVYGISDSSKVMRAVLEEFVACFMTDDELMERRKPQYATYPPPRLHQAMEAAKRNRKAASDGASGAGGSPGWHRILD